MTVPICGPIRAGGSGAAAGLQSAASLATSAPQTIPDDGVLTPLLLNSPQGQSGDDLLADPTSGEIVVLTDGWYELEAHVFFEETTAGTDLISVLLTVDGSPLITNPLGGAVSNSQTLTLQFGGLIFLTAGDRVGLAAVNDPSSTGPVDVTARLTLSGPVVQSA